MTWSQGALVGAVLAILVNHRAFVHAVDSNIAKRRTIVTPQGTLVSYKPVLVDCSNKKVL